jgi:SAM-dependent methyltransferase
MAAKAPTLYLRQSCVNDTTVSWKPGSFLEVGAGIGIMTTLFLERGFSGCCQDISPESRNYLNTNLQAFGNKIHVIDNFSSLSVETFDYLLAFEVLEHIENDLEALTEWSKFLKPKGKIIISVPAHQNKFSKADEYVGHVRRYEKKDLLKLLENTDYQNIEIVNYGFPLTGISRIIGNRIMAEGESFDNTTVEERNLKSSYSRPTNVSRYLSFVNEDLFIPFKYIQRWFYYLDWGDGLIAIAEKP